MGDRRARTTLPIQERDLVALTKKSIIDDANVEEDDDPFADWADTPDGVQVATGSQPEALPTSSRTATLADPMTTGLLAEVARRAATVELDPSTLDFAQRNTREIDQDVLEALRNERTPVPEPTIRKRTTTKK